MYYLLSHTIDEAASRWPDHDAFRCDGEAMTYATLVNRASSLARLLYAQGIRRGDRVGVYMNKSLESAIAVYGIMKAGAAFVPLDASAPVARLAHMIRHAGVRCLVTHPPKRRHLPELLAATDLTGLIGVEESPDGRTDTFSWDQVYTLPSRAPDLPLMEQDLAYLMYTSGSTGVPKGIMHTHHSGQSYARLAAHTYDLRPDDRLSGHAALHFDMSTLGYFAAPVAGATTVLIPPAYMKMPASLSALIEEERLTVWYSVPFALIQLLLRGVLDQRDCTSLRWVLYGGEPFPTKHLRALMTTWPHARFSNVYGPAEVNQCTYYHIPALPGDDTPVPIGQIWNNTQGLVLDETDAVCAPGETGELVIRSATMMRGYWQRDDLNARAFYHHEAAPGLTETYYRTGDLVHQQPDGLYQFLGRKDRQVKTRGHRVELDEVEAVLLAHEAVEAAAVFTVPDAAGSQEIHAAVITHDAIPTMTLLHHTADHLPWYAVPAHLTCRDTFPRTTSGKIDRKALQTESVPSSP